jgi:hypothetical protein
MSQLTDIIFLTYYFYSISGRIDHPMCQRTKQKEHHTNQHENEYAIDAQFTLLIKLP